MNFDGGYENTVKEAIPFATYTANKNDAASVDVTEGESLKLVVMSGAHSAGTLTPVVFEGDAANFSDGAAIDSSQLTKTPENTAGTLAGAALTDANQVKSIGIITKKARVQARLTSDSANMVAGGFFIIGKLKEKAL